MLEDQLVQFPFGGGLDEKTAPKHISPPKLTSLINGDFTKTGQIRKRSVGQG